MKKEMEKKRSTLEAEGTVLRAISLMLVKEEGMRSLMGRFVKLITLLPRRLPIFDPSFCFCESLKSQLTNVNRSGEWRVEIVLVLGWSSELVELIRVGPVGWRSFGWLDQPTKPSHWLIWELFGNENDFIIISIYFSENNNNNNERWWDQREGLFISFYTSRKLPNVFHNN